MTVVGWLLFVIGAISIIVVVVCVAMCLDVTSVVGFLLTAAIALGLTFGLYAGITWYYENTESGKRAIKDQESNFDGGISRRIDIYDMEGDLIKSYEGTFDVEMSDTRILFDDENGDRHIIYFTTGTVTIDELAS